MAGNDEANATVPRLRFAVFIWDSSFGPGFEAGENAGELEIDQTKAPVGLTVGHVANVRVVVPDSELLELGEQLLSAFIVEMLDAGAAVGGGNPELLLIRFQQAGHERAAARLEVPEDSDLVLKSLRRIGSMVGFDDPPIEGEVHRGPQRVFDFQHVTGGRIAQITRIAKPLRKTPETRRTFLPRLSSLSGGNSCVLGIAPVSVVILRVGSRFLAARALAFSVQSIWLL
jgi:hypothetical protein